MSALPPSPIAGGCHCGAVRYEFTGTPGFQILCQCRNCQRLSGSGFSTLMQAPKAQLVIRGPVTAYEYDNNGRGSMRRRLFCAKCGAPICGGNPAEDFVTLSGASLDEPDLFTPREIIHHDEARPWDRTAVR
jgi:hypothetical protein